MPDSDKISSLIEYGIFIGMGILGALGIKRARRSPEADPDDRIRELEKERLKLLSDAMESRIIAHINATDVRQTAARDMGLKSNRALFFETFEKDHNTRELQNGRIEQKIDAIDNCVRRIENELPEIRGEIELLKSRRPTQR